MTITLTREEAEFVLDAVSLAMSSHNVMLTSDPPQDAWKVHGVQTRLAGAWETLRTRLAQPEPEPVAYQLRHDNVNFGNWYSVEMDRHRRASKDFERRELYPSPPQREWQGLTQEEFDHINDVTSGVTDFARLIEAKLREKNA